MKSPMRPILAIAGAGFALMSAGVFAQGTAFTYQGRLNDGLNPATGIYDLRFALFDASSGGTQQGNATTNSPTPVTNGLFMVTLDFGNQFPGANRWLEIAVRTNGGGAFTNLSPRQALTPTPYAITAGGVVSGGIASGTYGNAMTLNNPANSFNGSYNGNGTGVTNVNAATLGGLTATAFWKTNGNAGANPTNGAFLGNTDNLPLEIKVNGQRALRIEPAAVASDGPNVIGGHPSNIVSNGVVGGFIGGGGSTGNANRVGGNYASVLGGQGNTASGLASAALGDKATASHDYSFVWSDGNAFASTAFQQFSVQAHGGVRFAANVSLAEDTYRYLSLNGGNALGYLYGSFPKWADGVHLGYNYYADDLGNNHVPNSSFGTSRITAGFSEIDLAVGGVNVAPSTVRLTANLTGVTVTGTFNNSSDRNAKQDFTAVSPLLILDRVLRLPVNEWSYKEDAATRHIGPVAQDFHAIFGIGTDDKHIAPIDEGGVALAAIQGLNQKLEEQKTENAELKRQLAELKTLVQKLAQQK
jgi:hypothetical protein